MRYKAFGQRSILDELLDNNPKRKKKTKTAKKRFLFELDQYIDWGIYRKPIEKSYKKRRQNEGMLTSSF